MKSRMIFSIICIFILMVTSVFATPANPAKLKVYLSASLFNERETSFNLELAKGLEEKGYTVILPQRDGFEYKALSKAISTKMPPKAVRSIVANTIYALNFGKFIPDSDVIIANLDYPMDEGVVVELTYAHLIGKPVIGIHTDVRSPYNSDNTLFGGVHSFVAYQCDQIINQHQEIKNAGDLSNAMNNLTNSITDKLATIPQSKSLPSYAILNPYVSSLTQASQILFACIQDIHSQQGLE